MWAHLFVTCSICSSSSVVNKSSSFFVSITGDSFDDIEIGFGCGDIGDCGVIFSGCNVAVSTSGNKTFSPF